MVNLLPAVLIAGPPHTGKSVLFYQLTRSLRDRGVLHHAIRVSPDGEGNWFHEGDPDTVSKIRFNQGKEWPAILVQRISQGLEHRVLPLLLDMGGNPGSSEEGLFRHCTHAILLLRSDRPEDMQRWEHLVTASGLLLLARIVSRLDGVSTISSNSPIIEGTLTGLKRHTVDARSSLFDELVDRIATLFSYYDGTEWEQIYLRQAPTSLVLNLNQILREFNTSSNRWEPAMLAPFLASLPSKTALSVYGAGPSWLYAALATHADSLPFHLFDPKVPFGWIQPVPVFLNTTSSPDIDITPAYYQDFTTLKVTFPTDYLEYFQPYPLAFPPLSTERGLIIEGRIPLWLLTALVRLYKDVGVPWIASYYARTNAAVITYSRTEIYRPGDSVPKSLF